jgi:hypothetical protein
MRWALAPTPPVIDRGYMEAWSPAMGKLLRLSLALLLAIAAGCAVDWLGRPRPLWSYFGDKPPELLAYTAPWLITTEEDKFLAWDLSSRSTRPQYQLPRPRSPYHRFEDHHHCSHVLDGSAAYSFLETTAQEGVFITRLQRWSMADGAVRTLRTWQAPTRNKAAISKDGTVAAVSMPLPLDGLASLAVPFSLGDALYPALLSWGRQKDATWRLDPQIVEVVNVSTGQTISRLGLPPFAASHHAPFVLSEDGAWLVSRSGMVPFLWFQTNPIKRTHGAHAERQAILAQATRDKRHITIPIGNSAATGFQLYGDLLLAEGTTWIYSPGGWPVQEIYREHWTPTAYALPSGSLLAEDWLRSSNTLGWKSGDRIFFSDYNRLFTLDLAAHPDLESAFAKARTTILPPEFGEGPVFFSPLRHSTIVCLADRPERMVFSWLEDLSKRVPAIRWWPWVSYKTVEFWDLPDRRLIFERRLPPTFYGGCYDSFEGIFALIADEMQPVGNGSLISTDRRLLEVWPRTPRHWSLLYPVGAGILVFLAALLLRRRRSRTAPSRPAAAPLT